MKEEVERLVKLADGAPDPETRKAYTAMALMEVEQMLKALPEAPKESFFPEEGIDKARRQARFWWRQRYTTQELKEIFDYESGSSDFRDIFGSDL